MPVVQVAAIAACILMAALAVFQAALIAGAPLGRFAWGGQHDVLPAKLRTWRWPRPAWPRRLSARVLPMSPAGS